MPEPAAGWQAEHLRVTCFCDQPPVDLWNRVAPEITPERDIREPRLPKAEQGATVQGRWLSVVTLPGRVDLIITRVPTEAGGKDITGIGPLPEALSALLEHGTRLLSALAASNRPVTRIALGGTLLEGVPDRISGYHKLATYLEGRVTLDAENSFDFSYRINRPRHLSIGEDSPLRINRLHQWAVLLIVETLFTVASGGFMAVPGAKPVHACQLTVDVNTDAERAKPIPPESLQLILNTLTEYCREVAVRGDCD